MGREMDHLWGINTYTNGISGTRNNTVNQSSGGSSFKEAVLTSLKSTESMDSIFEEAANTYGVPLNLLKAVGKAESNYNADAVSQAGAIGVMQLMPGTASALGVEDPYDARSNIMGGAKYLAQKLDEYDGNIELVLASYNAGSGNVAKYGGVPPFEETQNYVKRVMEYAGEVQNTGKEVQAETTNAVRNTVESVDETSAEAKKMCLYMIEMMRMQIQMKLQNLQGVQTEEL